MKAPTFTQAVMGPFDGEVLNVINPRPGDTIDIVAGEVSAKYYVTGRRTNGRWWDGYWEALYLDPDEGRIWRVLKESQPEPVPSLMGPALTLRSLPREVCLHGTLRRVVIQVCFPVDDGSSFSHRGALIQNILRLLPQAPLTSPPDHANGWTHESEQVGLCFVPTRSCGDYEPKPLQTHTSATASRSVDRVDRAAGVCYAGDVGAFAGGWRSGLDELSVD